MPGKLRFVSILFVLLVTTVSGADVSFARQSTGPRLIATSFDALLQENVVVAIDPSSGEVETLFTYEGDEYHTKFQLSPTGDNIAFVNWEGDSPSNDWQSSYYLAALSGGEPRKLSSTGVLTGTSALFPRAPIWSPDGSRLALHTREGVVITSVDPAQPTVTLPIHDGESPLHWSPDGHNMLFNTMDNHANSGSAFVIPVDNTEPAQILIEDKSEHDISDVAHWMPDSRHIFIMRWEGYADDNTRYFIFDLETMQRTEMELPGLYEPVLLHVLDEKTLLFSSQIGDDYALTRYDINSGQQTQVAVLQGFPYLCTCALSPDAAYYAYLVSGPSDLLQVFDLNTGLLAAEILVKVSSMGSLTWSPDSDYLIFTVPEQGLFRVKRDGSGGVQLLTDQQVRIIGWANP